MTIFEVMTLYDKYSEMLDMMNLGCQQNLYVSITIFDWKS